MVGQGVAWKRIQVVLRTSPEFQKDILTNMIPSDLFSKLNKKKAHGLLFVLLFIRPSAMRVVL